MMFRIKIDPIAIEDIKKIIDWYNEKEKNQGKKFYKTFEKALQNIKTSPYFQIRYDFVRCYPIKKYPLMIHYTIHKKEKNNVIRAVFHTSQDTDLWNQRSCIPSSSKLVDIK